MITNNLVSGQTRKLESADRYFELLAYDRAIPLYESLVGSKSDSPLLKTKLAQSYLFNNQLNLAVETYSQVFSSNPQVSVEHYFYYSQALKEVGKYKEADEWMSKYDKLQPTSRIADNFEKNRNYLMTINNGEKHFTIGNVAFNSTQSDFGGYQSKKKNALYFISSRGSNPIQCSYGWNGDNFLDLYSISAISSNQIKKAIRIKKRINSRYHEGPLCFNSEETKVYFTRNNLSSGKSRKDAKGIQNLMLYVADVDQKGKWSNINPLKLNSKDYSIGHPSISTDGKTLYFVSDMPGGFGGADLYKAVILDDGNIGTPENLGNSINTEGQEMFPWIAPNGQLFFSSNGLTGLGGLDFFVAELSPKGTVNAIQHCGKEINSNQDDFGLSFMQDGKTGYFSSNRIGGKGGDDIYSFSLIRPFIFKLILTGTVTDIATKTILPGTVIKLLDENFQEIDKTIADENGQYIFTLEPTKTYKLQFENNAYNSESVQVPNENPSGNIVLNGELSKLPEFGLSCIVLDSENSNPMQGVAISVKDKKTGKILMNSVSGATGSLQSVLDNIKIGDELDLEVSISKEGYLSKKESLKVTVTKAGMINIHEYMNSNLAKVEVGIDLATIIDIKPIYFDLGKSNIRKDAAIELDKIVKIMNEYPNMEIELGSHTDCRGSIASNATLSKSRAQASAEYIKKRILNPQRIYGKGFGESKLKVDCPCEGTVKSSCSEDEHQKNRRTEFIIIKM